MPDALKQLVSRPYWVIALVIGGVFVAGSCISITVVKDGWSYQAHSPNTYWLAGVGLTLIAISILSFAYGLLRNANLDPLDSAGDGARSPVQKEGERFWIKIGATCELSVVRGRVETVTAEGAVIALPCNEYFEHCADHPKSALGAFTRRNFDGQFGPFQNLIHEECRRTIGVGVEQWKTNEARAVSFSPGRCLLLRRPLDRNLNVALISTSVQRAGTGIYSRVSYLFEGVRELTIRMGDARLEEVVMPILGGGNGGLTPQLAFVGTLLAVAEAIRHGAQGHRLCKVTIVVFRPDKPAQAAISDLVIRRALSLIADPV